ncbi:hypothetical protein BC940DRAFT_41231 [Gongronella butleri]|nr:hypothetical protein BC940DRAFT_41231 [Gongronella butleri]
MSPKIPLDRQPLESSAALPALEFVLLGAMSPYTSLFFFLSHACRLHFIRIPLFHDCPLLFYCILARDALLPPFSSLLSFFFFFALSSSSRIVFTWYFAMCSSLFHLFTSVSPFSPFCIDTLGREMVPNWGGALSRPPLKNKNVHILFQILQNINKRACSCDKQLH